MNKMLKYMAAVLAIISLHSASAFAEDVGLQQRYQLTDEEVKTLDAAKLSDSDRARYGAFAAKTDKPIGDIIKMRQEQKMGWGEIAKELGIPPGEIGHAISDMKHERNDVRKEAHAERKAERMDAKSERKAERADAKVERKAEKEKK